MSNIIDKIKNGIHKDKETINKMKNETVEQTTRQTTRQTKIRVEALSTYKDYKIEDSELGFIPEPGHKWSVTKERLRVLTGDNRRGLTFVKVLNKRGGKNAN